MNSPFRLFSRWLIPIAVLAAVPAFAEDMQKPSDSPTGKSGEAKDDAPKIFRFKSEKKSSTGAGSTKVVVVEDMFTHKPENLNISSEANGIDGIADLTPGMPIEVKIERQKGRSLVTSIGKAELVPGEERPDGYVFLGWDRKKAADGKMTMGIRLKKFGREVMAQIPLTKDRNTGDWNPSGRVDYVLGRVKEGDAIMATIEPGKPPMLKDISEYYPPEKGKFIALVESEKNDVTFAAVKMTSKDGTELTITLPGTETYRGKKKIRMPDAKLLGKVQSLKPDTEIEVQLRGQNDYTLHDINVIAPPPDSKRKTAKAE